MGNTDSGASSGGVSKAKAAAWTHLKVDRRRPSYWRITFDHPPINTITATTVAELAELVGLIREDPDLNVVVFDSANPDFYLAHYDVENNPGKTAAPGGRSDRIAGLAGPACPPVPRLRGEHRVDPRAGPRSR
jgi:1,4-dihydroxy-2-naphthoyl-CoA synthase